VLLRLLLSLISQLNHHHYFTYSALLCSALLCTGQGRIFGVYFGQQPHFDLVDRLNLSSEDHSIIRVSSHKQCSAVEWSGVAMSDNR
jgi:hypothetical protein